MEKLAKKGILIAYGELFLKSEGVRRLFQKRLINNLRFFLGKKGLKFKIHPFRERVFVETGQNKEALRVIKKIFGFSWLAESFYFPKTSLTGFSGFVNRNYPDWISKKETFAIRLKGSKNREKTINYLAKKIDRKVDLSKPKKELFIEIRDDRHFLYFKKIKGAGGFPVGSSGKVLSLVSGGIDSPVAAFLAAKRGAENIWLHFHSFPLVSKASIDKVRELAKDFLDYQPHLKLFLVPFQEAQIKIKTEIPQKYRILLYRKLMFKIAERIAKKENCQALITGESLGQVSSQTLPNIRIIEESAKIPVLRPLICQDKEEIIKLAKKIGTFDISIRPQEDCCTLFVPKHQTAQGKIDIINKFEKKLEISKIIRGIIREVKIERY